MKEILQDLCFQNMFDSSIMSLLAEFQGVKLIGPVTNEPPNEGKQPSNLKHDPLNHAARTRII